MENKDKAIEQLMTYVTQAVEFGKEQMPDVAKEILVYSAYTNTIWMWVWLVPAVLFWALAVLGIMCSLDESACIPFFLTMVMLAMFLTVISAGYYVENVKIEKGPKLYIMEHLASMGKK